jgi:pimeloyl-ACP methyl ester carboxylesterase
LLVPMQGAADMPVRELRLQARGMTFAALAWGRDDAPLALCLHGYPDTPWTWRRLGPMLARRGWRVVAPYARGYAPSDLAADGSYEVGALARDAVALHRHLGADAGAVLIGHDWGAVTAYVLAAQRPELFRRVVTLSTPPPRLLVSLARTPGRTLRELPGLARQALLSWYMYFQLLPVISEHALPRLIPTLWRTWSPGYEGGDDVVRARAALDPPERRTAALRYYRALLLPWMRRRAYAAERSHLLRAPRVPLLYLHGEDDRCMHAGVARRGAETLPPSGRFVLVPGAGHFPQLEQADAVGAHIAMFIEDQV